MPEYGFEQRQKKFIIPPMADKWEKIKENLGKSLKSGQYQLWIRPLKGKIIDKTLFLYSPNDFITTWVKDKLLASIKKAAKDTLGEEIQISISTKKGIGSKPQKIQPKAQELYLPVKKKILPKITNFNWRHTFNEFVVGAPNEFAYAACRTLCTSKNFDFGKLFLTSSPGLGKTHLIHSVGHYLTKEKMSGCKVVYLPSEEFANKMVWAIKSNKMADFKKFFREQVDILMLEDIHFFQGKNKMQEELLYLIKCMEQNGKIVILSSSFKPKELRGIDSQLISYFSSSLIAPIEKPNYELRLEIIKKKAQLFNIHIPEHVCTFVAKKIKNDIRQLESCLKNMALKAKLLNMSVDLDLATEIVKNHVDIKSEPSIEEIIDSVCSAFNLSLERLRSRSRKKELVVARNTAFYLARKFTDLTLKEIGKRFNRRHSTVIKGITSIEKEMYRDTPLARQLIRLMERFEN